MNSNHRYVREGSDAELRRLEARLPFLATLGSAAPFIGLFGTLWGIMRSFEGIAAANNTSLAVVAPGIPEALFATAMGLAAAIPGRCRLQHDHRRSRPLCRAYARADRTIGGVLARGFGLISITRRAATTTD